MAETTDMKCVIIDYRADETIISSLKKLDYNVVPSMKNQAVSDALSGHPDMQVCKCSADVFVCAPECYEYYKKTLSSVDIKLICGKTMLGCNYPGDVAYNVAWIGDMAVCNTKHTDPVVLDTLAEFGVKTVNVSQGYSKCNICIVNDNAVITSDVGISEKLVEAGADVLLIETGHIDIIGWDYGFIGGASGKLAENKLVFCGNLSFHPDHERIIAFCNKYGVECISLSEKRLMDSGSLILV